MFKAKRLTEAAKAIRMIDIWLEAGLAMSDPADSIAGGVAGHVVHPEIKARRDLVLVPTAATLQDESGAHAIGSYRSVRPAGV